ncbi:sulfatase [Pontiella agarivorans]|uniref:Sulfatase n=1 Tax=Pontiella agarivorans TaxID=3038953 RepID=A0ABU5MUK6_9BACT|nr:sulfatase [Pontiella agarivorans]MDZ8117840.1 sulfatase [Pontiella agarivorans]
MKKWIAYFMIAAGVAMAAEKPNIVLFFVDDLGWNNLGYRNPDLFETPNIDQLAKDGIDFQQGYVAGPVCSPSRATLLTGKHPARLKMVRHVRTDTKKGIQLIYDEQGRPSHHLLPTDPARFPSKNWVDLEQVSYAEALKELGYYNLFLGKWHIGEEGFYPVDQGFDRQVGTTDHGSPNNYYPDYFRDTDILDEADSETYLTDRLTDELVTFIEGWDQKQPLMVSMWYYNVHSPNIGRKDLVRKFENRPGLKDEPKRVQYAAQVAAVDESIGRIRAALEAKGMDKNTVIVFTSDQGSLYEWAPYRGGKRVDTLCEGGARVPFIVSWPGVAPAGVRNDSIVQTADLFPTFVEIAGGNPAVYPDLDGVSLLPVIRENSTLKRNEPIYGYRAYEDLYASVREGDWKLLGYRSGKTALYNLKTDRVEQNDLAAKNPEKVQELVEKLKAWEKEMDVEQYSGFQ